MFFGSGVFMIILCYLWFRVLLRIVFIWGLVVLVVFKSCFKCRFLVNILGFVFNF